MSTLPLVADEHVAVSLPPPGPSVVLTGAPAVLDLVFTIQPASDAVVLLCDDHRHVLLLAITDGAHLGHVPGLAGALDPVRLAVIVTAHTGGHGPVAAARAAHRRLAGAFGAAGVHLLDWLQVDDRGMRSVAPDDPWG